MASAINATHLVLSSHTGDFKVATDHSNQLAGFEYLLPGQCQTLKDDSCCIRIALNLSLLAGSYSIVPSARCTYSISGGDRAALHKGFWRLLRALRLWRHSKRVEVPMGLHVSHSLQDELWPVRGHQISCGLHPAQFLEWSELAAYALDLSAFGSNQLELAHIGASSGIPVSTLANFSRTAAAVPGMQVSMWWQASISTAYPRQLRAPRTPVN